MSDDTAYVQARRNTFSIFRVTCLFWPMSFGALCLLLSIFGINPSESIRCILAFVYFFGLAAHSYSVSNYGTVSIFGDIKKRYKDQMMFSQTEELPKDPPLRDNGYVFARKKMEFNDSLYTEYSEPYFVEFKITSDASYVDTFRISLSIDGNKLVNDGRFSYEGCSEIKHEALKRFEDLGYNVVAIKNKYGDYMWIKGTYKNILQLQIIYIKLKMLLLQCLWFACQIAPLLWLLKPCVKVVDLD